MSCPIYPVGEMVNLIQVDIEQISSIIDTLIEAVLLPF
jgi:hypothetical protein